MGPPTVITKEVGGKKHEPFEEALVEVPQEHMGQVVDLLGQRKGQMLEMGQAAGEGATQRVKYRIPTRGLLVRPPIRTLPPGTSCYFISAPTFRTCSIPTKWKAPCWLCHARFEGSHLLLMTMRCISLVSNTSEVISVVSSICARLAIFWQKHCSAAAGYPVPCHARVNTLPGMLAWM